MGLKCVARDVYCVVLRCLVFQVIKYAVCGIEEKDTYLSGECLGLSACGKIDCENTRTCGGFICGEPIYRKCG